LAHGRFCCVDVRSLLQTSRVYIYTRVLTRLLVDYEYNIYYLNYCLGANVKLVPTINSSLPYIRATSSRIPECFLLQAQTALLPNDGILPTASIFTESFEEIFLPNGASSPNSAHKSVPFLYQFVVLTSFKLIQLLPFLQNKAFATKDMEVTHLGCATMHQLIACFSSYAL
jgi:hypothetical protein